MTEDEIQNLYQGKVKALDEVLAILYDLSNKTMIIVQEYENDESDKEQYKDYINQLRDRRAFIKTFIRMVENKRTMDKMFTQAFMTDQAIINNDI